MVLYHAVNTYQLMVCMVHACTVNHNKEKVLFLPSFVKRSIPQFEELRELGFFDEIIVFNYTKYNGKDREFIERELEKDIDGYLENYEFEEYYLGAAHYYLSLYLIKKQRYFYVIEDGAGMLSDHMRLAKTVKKQHVLNYDLLDENGMFDLSNPYIKGKIGARDAQKDGYADPLFIDFNIETKLKEMDTQTLQKVLNFWHSPTNINATRDDVVVLTQNFANLNTMSFDDQVDLYNLIKDLYIRSGKIIIKPHPNDIMYYEKILPEARIIKEKFPSELLPFVFSTCPRRIVNVSSTGMEIIKNEFAETLSFDERFETEFRDSINYYVACRLLQFLGISEIEIDSVNKVILDNLFISNNMELKIKTKAQTLVIGGNVDGSLNELDSYEVIVFMNFGDTFSFYDYISPRDIVPIEIQMENAINGETNKEYLYVYMKNREDMHMLMNFEFEDMLDSYGQKLTIAQMSQEQLYVKTLEAYVRALESRLKKYIDIVEGEKK